MGTIYSTDISGSANSDIGMHSNTKSNKQLTIGHLADVKENRCVCSGSAPDRKIINP